MSVKFKTYTQEIIFYEFTFYIFPATRDIISLSKNS